MMYISPVSHKTTCQDRSNAAGTAEQSPTHTRGCPPVPFIPGVTARVRSHSSHLSTELFLLLKPKEGVQVNTKRFIGFPCIKERSSSIQQTLFLPRHRQQTNFVQLKVPRSKYAIQLQATALAFVLLPVNDLPLHPGVILRWRWPWLC